MLYKVDALLQTIQLHERAHLFLAAIKYKINRGLRCLFLLLLFLLVLLQVQLSDDRIQIQLGRGRLHLLLADRVLSIESLRQVSPLDQYILESLHFAHVLKLAFELFQPCDVIA